MDGVINTHYDLIENCHPIIKEDIALNLLISNLMIIYKEFTTSLFLLCNQKQEVKVNVSPVVSVLSDTMQARVESGAKFLGTMAKALRNQIGNIPTAATIIKDDVFQLNLLVPVLNSNVLGQAIQASRDAGKKVSTLKRLIEEKWRKTCAHLNRRTETKLDNTKLPIDLSLFVQVQAALENDLSKIRRILGERLVRKNLFECLHNGLYMPRANSPGARMTQNPFKERLQKFLSQCTTIVPVEEVGACVHALMCVLFEDIYSVISDRRFGRSFERSDSQIILEDVYWVEEIFGHIVSSYDIEKVSRPVQEHIELMSKSTNQVIEQYQQNQLTRGVMIAALSVRRDDPMAISFLYK